MTLKKQQMHFDNTRNDLRNWPVKSAINVVLQNALKAVYCLKNLLINCLVDQVSRKSIQAKMLHF